jgi:hypothetical protein
MAQLSSPGVAVTVVDESFYTPSAPGTVPLIIVASAQDKQNGAGTGTAPGTLKSNAGKVYLVTSQKDLSDTFGTPVFKTDANNNPIHAGEQNEYGLQAAYSLLGVSNRAYVVRADLDLGQLDATATAPAGPPADGQYWFDTANSLYGVFQWNSARATTAGGQTFTNIVPTVISDQNLVENFSGENYAPRASIGAIGSYALVTVTTLNQLWYKKPATTPASPAGWVKVGSPEWRASWPTAQGSVTTPTLLSGDSIIINTVAVTGVTGLGDGVGAGLVKSINDAAIPGVTAGNVNGQLALFSTGVTIVLSGTTVEKVGLDVAGVTGPYTYKATELQISPHTSVPLFKRTDNASTVNGNATGSLWIKTTSPNLGAKWSIKKYNTLSASWLLQNAPLYANNAVALKELDSAGGGIGLPTGTVYIKFNDDQGSPAEGNFKIYARKSVGATQIVSKVVTTGTFTAGDYTFTISETQAGSATPTSPITVSFNALGTDVDRNRLLVALQSALSTNTRISASVNSSNQVVLRHNQGGDIYLVDTTRTAIGTLFSTTTTLNFYSNPTGAAGSYVASLWTSSFDLTASINAPTSEAADGQLWYSSIVDEVDIMIHNGTYWVGYKNFNHAEGIPGGQPTDALGPIVSATKPTRQRSTGLALANGDLWVDTSDLENYPRLHRYDLATATWVLVDSSDQTTENGILFDDARWNTNGTTATASSIVDLLNSDFLDPDAPDPALYPKGMLLWNLRRSGFNVKRYDRNNINTLERNLRWNGNTETGDAAPIGDGAAMTSYYPSRWVSVAANQNNGAGTFGRKAQRRVVIQALQATVNSNQEIRDEESRIFNLLACPGYPELITELVSLNYDRGLTAFVVGDTPARLTPDATTLGNWGNNTNGAVEDGDEGSVTYDEYLGVFYPWGFSSDNIGNNIAVPPSHMMLRTIALSDNVSYPWFAPAGTRRGGITNASAVGYITREGEFQSVALNTGQRDTLASIKVNPLTFITGTGLVNYGQYTRAKNASSLDRINVARLVIYLRRQFTQLAKPYVFEPNDKITRDEIKGAAENLLLELVGQRALYDYIAVCDTTNNTPSRIDRSELYLDIAIEPVKAVEFIYIPVRLKNTGEIAASGGA